MDRMVAPLKEVTMDKIQSVLTQLQNVMDVLIGFRPYQPLPEAYFQQTDWHETAQALRLPAIWRRNGHH